MDSLGVPIWNPLYREYGVNIYAGIIQAISAGLLLLGVELGKITINFFTIIKVALIIFIIISGFTLYSSDNITSWAPYGGSGILRGSTSAFFGYLGYDEVPIRNRFRFPYP